MSFKPSTSVIRTVKVHCRAITHFAQSRYHSRHENAFQKLLKPARPTQSVFGLDKSGKSAIYSHATEALTRDTGSQGPMKKKLQGTDQ